MRWWMLIGLLILLTACGTSGAPNGSDAANARVITWERRADAVVFRADVIGGTDAFRARSAIPLCTVFGDNRVMWVNPLDGFRFEVLYDGVSDDALREFVRYLTVDEAIYTFGWNADDALLAAAGASGIPAVTLTVNAVTHRTSANGGWDAQLFRRVLTMCKQLGRAPILFQPHGAWVSVQRAAYSVQAPVSVWEGGALGFSLAAAADAPARWLTGAPLLALWEQFRSLPSSLLYTEDYATYYAVALQVPGVMRDAPAAP